MHCGRTGEFKFGHHFIPHFLFGILKALSNKVNRLELCDGVFLEAGLIWVEGLKLGLICQAVLEENSSEMIDLINSADFSMRPYIFVTSSVNRKCSMIQTAAFLLL